MDAERLELEKSVIAHYMPNPNTYQFGNVNTAVPYLRIVAQTNNHQMYVLRLEMRNYPYEKPSAYVECMLHDHTGRPMNEASAPNHTLSPHPNGWTQICHYHPSAWKPNMSLWMVYVRCVLWLNIYEQSLRTGRTVDSYLRHMSENYTREDYLNH